MVNQVIDNIEVLLWGTVIGNTYYHNEKCYFEYSPKFLTSAIELAPITMPLSERVYSFPNLNQETYKGLPGLLADSLPDKFGNRLIDGYLVRNGREPNSFTPLERLCYVGKRGMGGLEFKPAVTKTEQSFEIDFPELIKVANQALSEKENLSTRFNKTEEDRDALEHIISVGTSAGGARAKAVVAWNKNTNEVRSGQLELEKGFEHWLLKFDGVTENKDKETLADPIGYSRLEYAYYLMAKDCGVEMMPSQLFEENNRAHFMTKRFDRDENGKKIHMLSLCGIAHYDFNMAGAYSYEEALKVMRQLKLSHNQLTQFFRRACLNIIARNQDDHTKNIAFLMDRKGEWRLSPAYDFTYCNGKDWTSKHQMSINGKTGQFTKADLIQLGEHANLSSHKANLIINEIIDTVSQWEMFAKKSGLFDFDKGWVAEVAKHQRVNIK